MSSTWFAFCASFLVVSSLFSQINLDTEHNTAYYHNIIQRLADDSMQGRPCCGAIEEKCAKIIKSEFAIKQKFKPKTQAFQFFDTKEQLNKSSKNVFLYINHHRDSTILVGAHYDHIGLGGQLSKSFVKNQIHNGADDNASGIALLLSLTKDSFFIKNKTYNYIFVAYSAHEIGLYGSNAFSELIKKKKIKLKAVINFDMVGRMSLKDSVVKVISNQPIATIEQTFNQVNIDLLKMNYDIDNLVKLLDTKAFEELKTPCYSFTTGLHNDYHKTTDDIEKINYKGIFLVAQLVKRFLMQIR